MLSDETARLLEFIASFDDGAPQNQFPVWARWRDIDDLERRGLISFSTLLPPDKEPAYPRGLYAAHITTAGRDALSASADEKRRSTDQEEYARLQNQLQDKRWRKDALRSWVQWAITTILSIATFFAGAMIEKHTGFMDWIISLFH